LNSESPRVFNHDKEMSWYVVVLVLAGLAFGTDAIGSSYSHSATTIGDGVHVLLDTLAIGISMLAAWRASGANTLEELEERTNGRRQIGLLLYISALAIACMSTYRLFQPAEVIGWAMAITGGVGALINLTQYLILRRCACDLHDGLARHVLADLVVSIAATVGGLSGVRLIDTLLGFGVSYWIARTGYELRHGHSHHHHHKPRTP
jgi:Co/Zn/Cd efflux system component